MDNRPLRVALFSDSALPILNGVSVSINALVHELRSLGHSVTIFTAAYPGYRDEDPNTYRFPAIRTPWARDYPVAVPPFYPMLREFRKQSFDIVHTHTPFTIGYVGLRWAESHHLPVVSTYHTLYDRYAHYIPLPRRYVRFKIAKHTNFYYSHVDHVITPSEAARKWLQRHSVETPVTVVPTGITSPSMISRSEARMELDIAPNEQIMLYVGRLAPEKNLPVLFEAAKIALENNSRLRLWLVGDGSFRDEATKIVRDLGIGDRVRFVGSVPRSEVDRYYAASDMFVFSSITETQGLVLQEAMSYGLPAVVANGGGASAAVETGVSGIVTPNDPVHLGEAMLRLSCDDALYAALADGARRAVRGHTTRDMAERIVEIYRSVIDARELGWGQSVLARMNGG